MDCLTDREGTEEIRDWLLMRRVPVDFILSSRNGRIVTHQHTLESSMSHTVVKDKKLRSRL